MSIDLILAGEEKKSFIQWVSPEMNKSIMEKARKAEQALLVKFRKAYYQKEISREFYQQVMGRIHRCFHKWRKDVLGNRRVTFIGLYTPVGLLGSATAYKGTNNWLKNIKEWSDFLDDLQKRAFDEPSQLFTPSVGPGFLVFSNPVH